MRVAHVITRMILGGAQENTLLNCQGLIEQFGDDVLLITGPALGTEGTLLPQAERVGIPLAILPSLRRAIHPLRDAASYRAVHHELRRFAPQVVHTHSAKGGVLGRGAAHALGVPAIVHTVHGSPFHPYQGRAGNYFNRACERWAARRCHAMICVSDAMRDRMVEGGVASRERFTTIYSGMEVDPLLNAEPHRAAMRARWGFADDEIVVGKIARLFDLKGHDDLIEAARQLASRQPKLRYLLVGDGPLRESLERRIESLQLADRFVFAGLLPPDEIPAAISAMDLVVHTSLREGLARVLPQALIAGRPVVSYDIDGAREVVRTDETGILVVPRDLAGLTTAIDRLASDAPLRRRIGGAGRGLADQFRHERMSQRIRELYERVLAGDYTRP